MGSQLRLLWTRCNATIAANAALVVGQWQYCMSTYLVHELNNVEHEAEQATNVSSL